MSLRPKAIFLIIFYMGISGCDSASDWIEKKSSEKTNIGYSQCLKENEDVGLSSDTVKKLCSKKHQVRIYEVLDGRAGYECSYGSCTFSGYFENKSDNYIATSLKVSIRHQDNKDSDGNIVTEVASSPSVWIEPGSGARVTFYDLKFKPKEDRIQDGKEYYYSWSISEGRGIKVKLK